MYRVSLLVLALRWRLASSVTLLAVATAAMVAAAVGPMYSLAADESIVRNTLSTTSIPDRGLTLTAELPVRAGEPVDPPTQRAQQALQVASQTGISHWFGTAVRTISVGISLPPTASESPGYATSLVAREGVCAHLEFVRGACPHATGETVISDRSATQIGAGLASTIAFRFSGQPTQTLKVVGVYHPGNPRDAYWFGRDFFTFAPPPPSLGGGPPFELDALFATEDTLNNLGFFSFPFVTEELPLMVERVNQANMSTLQTQLASYSRVVAEQQQITTRSMLPSIITQLQDQETQMAEIVALSALQLVLIALLLLYSVVATSAQVREHEVALARVRGHGRGGVLLTGLLEPLSLLVIAVPVGVLVAWLVVRAIAGRLLISGTPVALDLLTAGAVLAALAGGAAVAVLAGGRLLVRSLHDQLRAARSSGAGGNAARIGDVVAVTLALAGLAELVANGSLRGGRADALAVLAPGLLVIAASVIAIRLLPLVLTPLLAATRGTSASAVFLALRRLVRLPEIARQILIPALALGLASFALSAFTVADHNRAQLAGFELGADRVLMVDPAAGTDLSAAVRRADPGGRAAMAAVQYEWPGGFVLAVDSTRFASVANWPAGISDRDAASIARWLSSADGTKLPAVVTPNQIAFNGQGDDADIHAEGIDGTSLHLDGRVHANALPRLGASGVLVDLAALDAHQHQAPSHGAQSEVWLSPAAPGDIERRLADQGLTVTSIQKAAGLKSQLDAQGLPLAFDLMLIGSLAAAVLALGSSMYALAAGARSRSFELAILRVCGWSDRVLFAAMLGEQLVVAGVACIVGAAAGIAGVALTMPSVPEFTDVSWNVPLQFDLPAAALAILFAAFAILLLATGTVAAFVMLRASGPARLRAGPA